MFLYFSVYDSKHAAVKKVSVPIRGIMFLYQKRIYEYGGLLMVSVPIRGIMFLYL